MLQSSETHKNLTETFAGSQINLLTPRQRAEVGIVSEEELDDDGIVERPKHGYEPRSWRNWLQWLTQTGASRKKLPPVGQFCLILKGDADKNMGQMGIVLRQTKCMVAIVWKDAKNGRVQEKLKQPDSLIQLEDGLRVVQDADGMLWVVRQREM
jgi:hypothetical protein